MKLALFTLCFLTACGSRSQNSPAPSAKPVPSAPLELPAIAPCPSDFEVFRQRALAEIQAQTSATRSCESWRQATPVQQKECRLSSGEIVQHALDQSACNRTIKSEAPAEGLVEEALKVESPPPAPEFPIGTRVWLTQMGLVGRVGTLPDADKKVVVSFEDPLKQTQWALAVNPAELVRQYDSPLVSLCGMRTIVDSQTVMSGKDGSIFHPVALFPNGQMEVDVYSPSTSRDFWLNNRPLERSARKVIATSEVAGLETKSCVQQNCPGRRFIVGHSLDALYRDFFVRKVFCDGTLILKARRSSGANDELIVPAKTARDRSY